MITSKSNAKVKNIIDLQKHAKSRVEQKVYVVEGLKMLKELPRKSILEVYATAEFAEKNARLLEALSVELVDDRVFAQMSDTRTPQGILCVAKQAEYCLDEMMELARLRVKSAMTTEAQPFLLVLEDLQDPGNVGTIFRTAEGAGIDGIILSANCVDVYNPKVVRGAMGSIWRVPFFYADDLMEILDKLEDKNITTYAAHLAGTRDYDEVDYRGGSAFLIGNEGNGLSENLAKAAKELIKIPMAGEVESLNAAIATTILIYEGARQRRR